MNKDIGRYKIDMKKIFRIFGWLEGLSFLLLLLLGLPMKYGFDMPIFVRVLGPIHGGLFLTYVAFALWIADQLNWSTTVRMQALLAAVLPMGTFIFEGKYLK